MSEALVAGLLAGYGVAVPVGAVAVLIIGLTARTSWRVGAAAALGAATADGLYAALAVLGGAALADLLAPVAGPMRWCAALVLVAFAAHTAVAAVRGHRSPPPSPRAGGGLSTPARAYAGVLGLTVLNPATMVYFGALVLGRQGQQSAGAAPAAAFVLAALVASASWQLLLASGGALLGRVLTGPRGRLGTALASSVAVGALAVALVVPLGR